MAKGKIVKIERDITVKNDIMCKVWFEGDDITSSSDAKIFLNGCEYLLYVKEGNTIEYTTKNKPFANLIIPEAFNDVYGAEKGWGKALKIGYDNFSTSLKRIKNGEKNEMVEAEIKPYTFNLLDDVFMFADLVYEYLQGTKSKFGQLLNKQFGLKKTSRMFDPEFFVLRIAESIQREFSKHFKAVRDD